MNEWSLFHCSMCSNVKGTLLLFELKPDHGGSSNGFDIDPGHGLIKTWNSGTVSCMWFKLK